MRTLNEILREQTIKRLADKLNISTKQFREEILTQENRALLNETVDLTEVQVMMEDMVRATKEEIKNENLTIEALEIIGGYNEIVGILMKYIK